MAAELPNCGDYEGNKEMQIKDNSTHGKHTKIVVIVSAAATILGAALAASAAPAGKTDVQIGQMMAAPSAHASCAVIAQVNGDLSPIQQAQLVKIGADVTRHLGFIHSVALTLPSRNLGKLAALPFVTHISYDGKIKKCDEFTVASSGAGIAYQSYGLTGAGVGVAVLDSGMQNMDDLGDPVEGGNRIIAQQNFVPNWNDDDDSSEYTDRCGHGTHVAGIIAGAGQRSTGEDYAHTYYGIARRANLINVRVLDENGAGTVSSMAAGLQWVIANKAAYNIRVINLSLGHPVGDSYKNDPLCQAVESAWNAGIVVVCAAGNNGRTSALAVPGAANEGWGTAYGSIQSPANDPYVITVGATKSMDGTRADDKIATYSGRGPSRIDMVLKPDIIAPGNRVISLYSYDTTLYRWGSVSNAGLPMSAYTANSHSGMSTKYFVLSGTSMACPVVAGAAALMLEKYPSLSPDTVKARLMVSADKWTDPTGNADPLTYGAGYLNIPNALLSTVTPTQSALSPQLTLTAAGEVLINTNLTVYGTKTLSGVTTIWGSKAISGVSTIYGSKALSGVSTVAGSKALSGVNTLTSSKALSGSSVWFNKTLSGSSSTAVDLSNVTLSGE